LGLNFLRKGSGCVRASCLGVTEISAHILRRTSWVSSFVSRCGVLLVNILFS
jgi:hypothetical protein